MIFYHRTSKNAADRILREGFRDGTSQYMTDQMLSGVWLSEVPFDANDGAWGDTLLRIEINTSEDELTEYEWIEDGKTRREWLIPSAFINKRSSIRVVSEEVDEC